MSAAVYVPENRQGWWGGLDTRPRCERCGKVAFAGPDEAERSAANIRARGNVSRGDERMAAYRGKCGNWHVGHSRQRQA